MAQIFGPKANLLSRLSIYGAFGAAAIAVLALVVYSRSPYPSFLAYAPQQPVPFSHLIHVGQRKIDCRYCHSSVEVSASAGIPPTQTCMTCHSQVRLDSPNLAPVRNSYASGTPIEWTRVHDLGDFVYFNHSIHVNKGVGCSTCHGQVSQMGPAAPGIDQTAPMKQVQPLTMGWCLNCHRAPEQYLRPQSEIFNTDYVPPDNQLEIGRQLIQQNNIQVSKLENCSICHR
jgi:hypothetical protein